MAATNEMAGPGKHEYAMRETHELNLRRAADSGDTAALYNAFTEYLTWDRKNKRRSKCHFELRCSLYERALLRFPTVVEWWLDLADFVLENRRDHTILSILERATRHCPWSGDLWSRRVLRAEVDKLPYDEVEQVKHKATNSGLLSIGGMEEVKERLTASFLAPLRHPLLRRLYGNSFLVDESLWQGRAPGRPFGLEGRNRPLEFRMLHVIEFAEDGAIRRENVWVDLAAVIRQLPQD